MLNDHEPRLLSPVFDLKLGSRVFPNALFIEAAIIHHHHYHHHSLNTSSIFKEGKDWVLKGLPYITLFSFWEQPLAIPKTGENLGDFEYYSGRKSEFHIL